MTTPLSYSAFVTSDFARSVLPGGEHSCPECSGSEEEDLCYAAEVLHEVYCHHPACEWEGEECFPDEWVGAEHQQWLRIAQAVARAGISLEDAVECYSDVLALSRAR